MYLFRHILFCAFVIFASTPAILAMDDAAEYHGEPIGLCRRFMAFIKRIPVFFSAYYTKPTNWAVDTLAHAIVAHNQRPYTIQELRKMETLVGDCKDHLNTPLIHAGDQDLSIPLRTNTTCLSLAIDHNQLDIVKLLLNHGASVYDVKVTNSVSTHAIHKLTMNNVLNFDYDIDMLTTLLQTDDQAADTINTPCVFAGNNEYILHNALRHASNIMTIKQKVYWLMYYGANPALQDDNHETAFDIANDPHYFSNPADRSDLLDILHKKIERPYSRKFFKQNTLGISGNTATYLHNRAITGPWKGTQRKAIQKFAALPSSSK